MPAGREWRSREGMVAVAVGFVGRVYEGCLGLCEVKGVGCWDAILGWASAEWRQPHE